MAETEKVPLQDLVLDRSIYPRGHAWPNLYTVSNYARAMRGGAEFPPIKADRVSRRVIDGWHRYHAAQEAYGVDASFGVEWQDYANEQEMLIDAIRLNVAHGAPLTGIDRANLAQRLELEFRLEAKEIAIILATEEDQVIRLLPRYAEVPDDAEGNAYGPAGGRRTALKRGFRHFRQQRMTAEQFAGHQHAGYAPTRTVSDMINALTNDLFDWDSKTVVGRLCFLQRELRAALDTHGIRCED